MGLEVAGVLHLFDGFSEVGIPDADDADVHIGSLIIHLAIHLVRHHIIIDATI